MEEKKKELAEEIQFIRFQQYEFTKQWTKLKKYANDQGIRIIGDIPIYVAFDSADAWAAPELFQFDEECTPTAVAAARLMRFLLPASFGETLFMTGNITKKQDLSGGYGDWNIAISFMM